MRYIITALVASVVLFATNGTASAQHRGIGHALVGHSGGGHYRAGHYHGHSVPIRQGPNYSAQYSSGGFYAGSNLGYYGNSVPGPRVQIYSGPVYRPAYVAPGYGYGTARYGHNSHFSHSGHHRHR